MKISQIIKMNQSKNEKVDLKKIKIKNIVLFLKYEFYKTYVKFLKKYIN